MVTTARCTAAVAALACVLAVGCNQSNHGDNPFGGYSANGSRALPTPPPLPVQPSPTPSPAYYGAPTISGISPRQGSAGTRVTITGSGFRDLTDVRIGGVQVVNIEYLPEQIVGVVGTGASAPGSADVEVLSPHGNAVLLQGFVYQGPEPTPSPSPAPGVTYTNTIARIIQNDCIQCHPAFGTYQSISGLITPGSSASSQLVQVVQPSGRMSGKMSASDIATVSAWIDAGAPQ